MNLGTQAEFLRLLLSLWKSLRREGVCQRASSNSHALLCPRLWGSSLCLGHSSEFELELSGTLLYLYANDSLYRWNFKADYLDTRVYAAVLEALPTLDTLTSVSFGILPQCLTLPDIPRFPSARHLSLFVYTRWGFEESISHSDLVSTNARLLASFPGLESLAIHYDSPYDDEREINRDLTVKHVFAQCSPERAPPLKKLDLVNFPLYIDDSTTHFFASLETISTTFTSFPGYGKSCDGRLPNSGSTTLHTLSIVCSCDESAFKIIPQAGLRHLCLVGMGHNGQNADGIFTRQTLEMILPEHRGTLESLVLSPYRDAEDANVSFRRWTYDTAMATMLAEFTKLRHLAIPIFVEQDDTPVVRSFVNYVHTATVP